MAMDNKLMASVRGICFAAAGAWLTVVSAQAQIGLSVLPERNAKSTVAEQPAADERVLIEAALAEIEGQRGALATVLAGTGGAASAETLEQKRLLDRLLVVHGDKLKRLDDIAALQKTKPLPLQANLLVKELGEKPPYAALTVDALRDEFDGLRDRQQALTAGLAVRETEKQEKQAQLQSTAEAQRLADDRLAKATGEAALLRARAQLELANLRRQVAEAELGAAALEEERLKRQLARLKAQTGEMQTFLARVLPAQRLGADDLERLAERTRSAVDELGVEIDRLSARNIRHVEERTRLTEKPGEPLDKARLQRRAYLDQALETESALLQGLKGLQLLHEATLDAWRSRHQVLTEEDAALRAQALATLKKYYAGLTNRKRLSQDLREVTRVAIREQENRLANLPQYGEALRHEQRILALMQQRAEIHERVELAASRLERRLARWLGDLAAEPQASLGARAAGAGVQLKQWFAALWNYELFAVEDVSEIEGRKVSVSYGITVGKSIGALLLFAFGYWLFSRLARLIEGLLVRRFGVNPQLARVVRRWAMLSLALVLVVFVLNLARIPLTVFAFLGGALAIGVGFGTQNIIKNFISGIIILFERKIRVGDIIEAGGMAGYVTAVDLRATTLRGFDGVEALVPNSSFLENQVINWTYTSQQIRREIKVGIAYGSDTQRAAQVLLAVAGRNAEVLPTPAPEVFFEAFGDSELLLVLVYWVELGPDKSARRIDSDIRHAVYAALATEGIEMAFPQRDVHLDVAQPIRVALAGESGGRP